MKLPKLIIQIPCFNEEHCLLQVLRSLPCKIDGVGEIEFLVIDDGSRDKTLDIARNFSVHHVLSLPKHMGLARAYAAGIRYAVEQGADLIVNTDGDHQYDSSEIANLVQPVLAGNADLVVGTRERSKFPTLPFYKRALYWTAAKVVSLLIGQRMSDPASGFRCISRRYAEKMRIRSRYTYTIETLIFAAAYHYRIVTLPVQTHPVTRPSRLIRSIPQYVWNSALAMIGFTFLYRSERWLSDLNATPSQSSVARSRIVPSTPL